MYPFDSHELTYTKIYVTQMSLTSLYLHILILVLFNNYVNCCYHAGCQVYTTIVHSKCSSGMYRFHSNRKGKHTMLNKRMHFINLYYAVHELGHFYVFEHPCQILKFVALLFTCSPCLLPPVDSIQYPAWLHCQ